MELAVSETPPFTRFYLFQLASRVANEMQCSLGDRVGYVLRFNEVMSERTRVCLMRRIFHREPA